MSIQVKCSKGHRLVARSEVAGKRIKCPKCGDIVTVPVPAVEEVIDLSVDDLIDDDPPSSAPDETTAPIPTGAGAQPSSQAPLGDDPFAGLPPLEGPAADSPLESPPTEDLLDSLPDFPSGRPLPDAPQPIATPLAKAAPQPVPASRAPASPTTDAVETGRLTPGIIAAAIASVSSLILGLVVMSMLLIGRGDRPTQVAQAMPVERAIAEDSTAMPERVETERVETERVEPGRVEPGRAEREPVEPGPPQQARQTSPPANDRERTPVDSGDASQKERADAERPPAVAKIHSPKIRVINNYMPGVAFDQRTGDVALTDESGKTAIYRAPFFGGERNAVTRLEPAFEEGAEYLVFKPWNDRTLLLTSDGKKVWIYDAATGSLLDEPEEIANPIAVSRPGLYSSENPQDKRFYTAASEVVLSPYTEERPITNASEGTVLGVSPSGRMIFGAYPTFSFPATLGDGYGTLRRASSVSHLPMDPTDQVWKLDDYFLKWDGAKAIRARSPRDQQTTGILLAYVPDSPWTIFLTEKGISLVHRESLETKEVMPIDKPERRLGQSNTRGYVDQKNNRFLLVTSNTLSSIPLDSFHIPDEPLLGVQIDLPAAVRPGEQVEAIVRAAPGVKFSMQTAPDGAMLNDDRLTWTPSYEQLGHHDLVFRCKAGSDISDQKVAVFVTELGVDLPFTVARSFLSDDGTLAVAVSALGPDDQNRFALIDTETRKFRISADSIAGSVRSCCFDRSEIYLLMSTYELHVFDTNTLKRKSRYFYGTDDLHLRTRRSPSPLYDSLRLLDDKLVVQNQSRLRYFQRSDLSVADAVAPIDDPKHPGRIPAKNGSVQFGPALLDADGSFQRFLRLPNLVDVRGDRIHDPLPQVESSVRRYAELGGTRLAYHKLKDGLSLTREGPLLIYGQRKRDPVLNAAGECVSISVGGALVLVHPYEAGLLQRPKAPDRLSDDKEPLRIVGKGLPVVASGQRKTKFQFEITGGTPPYKINSGIKDVRGPPAFPLNERTGVGVLDGAALAQAMALDAYQTENRIKGMLGIPEVHGRDLADAIKSYRDFASKTCSRYSTVTFKEFPVAVTLSVSISDSKGNGSVLQHMFALEVPVRSMLAQIKDKSKFTIRAEPQESKQRNQNTPSNRPPQIKADFDALETVVISKSTGDLRKDFFNHLRRFQLDDGLQNLSLKHRAMVHVLPQIGRSLNQRSPTTLTLANRESVTGTISSITRNRIEMQTEGRRKSYPPQEFSPDSLARLLQMYEQSRDSKERSSDQAEVLETLKEYRWKRGFLLPNAIDGPDGTPLLSWRVLLLPYLGYTELFSLFRLDEPWDSAHNRQLIPYMPHQYVTDPGAAAKGLAAIEVLSGDQTLFPPSRLIQYSSIDPDQYRNYIIGVIKRPELASEWTKPSDIRLTENKLPYDMIQEDTDRYDEKSSLFSFDLGFKDVGPIPGQKTDSRRRSNSPPPQHQMFITGAIP